MITLTYDNFKDGVSEKYNVRVNDDEATLGEVLYSFVKVCMVAGYRIGSFDRIVKESAGELDDSYTFKEFLEDKYMYID